MKIIKIIRDGAEPGKEKGGPGGARAQDRVDRSGENTSLARARIAKALEKNNNNIVVHDIIILESLKVK